MQKGDRSSDIFCSDYVLILNVAKNQGFHISGFLIKKLYSRD
jgi:hypothetical protein